MELALDCKHTCRLQPFCIAPSHHQVILNLTRRLFKQSDCESQRRSGGIYFQKTHTCIRAHQILPHRQTLEPCAGVRTHARRRACTHTQTPQARGRWSDGKLAIICGDYAMCVHACPCMCVSACAHPRVHAPFLHPLSAPSNTLSSSITSALLTHWLLKRWGLGLTYSRRPLSPTLSVCLERCVCVCVWVCNHHAHLPLWRCR